LAGGGPLSCRINDLKRARAELEQEVLQLKATLRIWTEVHHRQTASTAAGSEALNAEVR
jgi:hypothetical protein